MENNKTITSWIILMIYNSVYVIELVANQRYLIESVYEITGLNCEHKTAMPCIISEHLNPVCSMCFYVLYATICVKIPFKKVSGVLN